MKQTVLMRLLCAIPASLLLSLSLFILAGCSGSEGTELSQGSEQFADKYELGSPDYIALKKAYPNHKDFTKALRKLQIDEMKAAGAVVKSTASRKMRK